MSSHGCFWMQWGPCGVRDWIWASYVQSLYSNPFELTPHYLSLLCVHNWMCAHTSGWLHSCKANILLNHRHSSYSSFQIFFLRAYCRICHLNLFKCADQNCQVHSCSIDRFQKLFIFTCPLSSLPSLLQHHSSFSQDFTIPGATYAWYQRVLPLVGLNSFSILLALHVVPVGASLPL